MAERQGCRVSDLILGDPFALSLDLAVWRTVWKHEAEQRKKK